MEEGCQRPYDTQATESHSDLCIQVLQGIQAHEVLPKPLRNVINPHHHALVPGKPDP